MESALLIGLLADFRPEKPNTVLQYQSNLLRWTSEDLVNVPLNGSSDPATTPYPQLLEVRHPSGGSI
jgi:hypothetical protein